MTAPKYSPDLAQRFFVLCSLGKSMKEIATEFLVNVDVLASWAKDENKPEFKEAYELGKQAMEAYYDRLGHDNLDNPRFKEGLYKFITGVRFNWSEKSEQTIKNKENSATEAELDLLIKDKLRALGLTDTDVQPK